MSLSLACFIGLATFDPSGSNKGWPTFNIILSIFLILFILIIPVVLYRIILKNQDKLRDTSFLTKYSSLYECLDYSKPQSLFYVLILFFKRLVISFSLVVVRTSFILQFLLVTVTTLVTLTYYIKYRPFSTDHINRMELMNEITLMACLYTCLLFTDYQPGENSVIDKPRVGWAFICIVLINLAINFAGIISVIFKFIIVLFRKAKAMYTILKRLWGEFNSKKDL